MRILSNPTRCILFFDVDCDHKKINVELDQDIPTDNIKIKIFHEGVEITDLNFISVISDYMLQKYIITYEDSGDSQDYADSQPLQDPQNSTASRLDPAI